MERKRVKIYGWMICLLLLAGFLLHSEETTEEKNKDRTIYRQTLFLLPFGRDFTSLFSILPGVTNEPLLGGLSIHGASGAENRFFVDGAETTNLLNGTSGQQVNLDFAESIIYKTFGFEAKDNAAMGGTIQVITRSGGNQFHGGFTGYFNSNWLSGKQRKILSLDHDDYDKARYYSYDEWVGADTWNRYELGFNLSGTLIKEKLWFYGAFIPNFYTMDRTCDFKVSDYKEEPLDYIRNETSINYQLKLTAQPSQNIRLGTSMVNNSLRYQGLPQQNNDRPHYNDYWYNPSYERQYEHHTKTKFYSPKYTLSGYVDFTPSKNLMINLRGNYSYSNYYEKREAEPSPNYYFSTEVHFEYSPTTNDTWRAEYAAMGHSDKVKVAVGSRPTIGVGTGTKKHIQSRTNGHINITYSFDTLGEHTIRSGLKYSNLKQDSHYGTGDISMYFAWDCELDMFDTEYGRGEYGWLAVRGNSKSPYGSIYKVHSEQWAIYLQDSWTIGDRLTLNLGIRVESEYLPNYSDYPRVDAIEKPLGDTYYNHPSDMDIPKPLRFTFADKLSPRIGFVYDVLGNNNLKVFGHFGIYYDVMKLNMAINTFGGYKWNSAYYPLDTLRWWEMDGEMNGQEPWVVVNFRPGNFEMVDPNLKPMTQREISFGFESNLSQNLKFSGHVIHKSLLQAIEDFQLMLPDESWNDWGRYYFYSNPGSDFVKDKYQEARDAGTMESDTPDLPKAKREYWGVTLKLEKRFSNNWMGGISVTWSSLRGNYSGLASSDENGRNSPYTERAFDLWHLYYTKDQQPIDGPLPTHRPIAAKAYGGYVTPFGLTIGTVVNAMSGTPVTEEWNVDSTTYFPFGRGNMGRTPFLFLADLLISQDIRFGKVTLNLNATIHNLFNAGTVTGIYSRKTRFGISPTDRQKIDNSWTFESKGARADPRFEMENSFVPPIQVRLGAKILF